MAVLEFISYKWSTYNWIRFRATEFLTPILNTKIRESERRKLFSDCNTSVYFSEEYRKLL